MELTFTHVKKSYRIKWQQKKVLLKRIRIKEIAAFSDFRNEV